MRRTLFALALLCPVPALAGSIPPASIATRTSDYGDGAPSTPDVTFTAEPGPGFFVRDGFDGRVSSGITDDVALDFTRTPGLTTLRLDLEFFEQNYYWGPYPMPFFVEGYAGFAVAGAADFDAPSLFSAFVLIDGPGVIAVDVADFVSGLSSPYAGFRLSMGDNEGKLEGRAYFSGATLGTASAPEPVSLAMLAIGAAVVGLATRRRGSRRRCVSRPRGRARCG